VIELNPIIINKLVLLLLLIENCLLFFPFSKSIIELNNFEKEVLKARENSELKVGKLYI